MSENWNKQIHILSWSLFSNIEGSVTVWSKVCWCVWLCKQIIVIRI